MRTFRLLCGVDDTELTGQWCVPSQSLRRVSYVEGEVGMPGQGSKRWVGRQAQFLMLENTHDIFRVLWCQVTAKKGMGDFDFEEFTSMPHADGRAWWPQRWLCSDVWPRVSPWGQGYRMYE